MPIIKVSTGRRLTRRHAIEALVSFGISAGFCLRGEADAETALQNPEPKHPPRVPANTGSATWLKLPFTPTLPKPVRSGLVSVNATSIFFAQFGAGPPVLLLHGGLANSNYWGYLVTQLSQSFSVTVMDTRGHGRSPVTSGSFSYRLFAEDVTALLDLLEIPAVSIVGWSDGAITGLQLAMTRPDRGVETICFWRK